MIFITILEGHTSWWPSLFPLCQDLLSSQPLSSLSSQDMCSHIQYFVQQSVTDLQVYFYYLLLGWCVWCALVRGLFFSFVWILFPVLCHLWSTLLPNGQQEEKSHKCTPEAVLSSPQLGSIGTTVPMLTQY